MAREESSVPPCWSEVDTRVSVGVPMVSLGGVFVPCEGRERADIRTDGAEGKDRKERWRRLPALSELRSQGCKAHFRGVFVNFTHQQDIVTRQPVLASSA